MQQNNSNRFENSKKTTSKEGPGRPQFDGKNEEIVLSKLEAGYLINMSDEEACLIAGISVSALYRYQRDHPEFKDRKHLLKTNPMLRARRAIFKGLDNPKFALKYMRMHNPEEFGGAAMLRDKTRQNSPWQPSPVSERVQELANKYYA